VFTVVTRADGTHQLQAGKWPLYTFAGDAAPGDVNGQGSAGVWFAVNPAGGLIK
jgi:predicted lipoprotein with Yx(FWY)xxD motif